MTASETTRVEIFREVYDEMYPRIMGFAHRRARSREDALDAVGETFLSVWRRLHELPADDSRVSWVYGIARGVLANQHRSSRRASRLRERLRSESTRPEADPSFDLVHEALDRLSATDRELLTLVAWDDLDNREIAQVMGIGEENVAVRLHRARRRLGKELERLRLSHANIEEG